VVRVLEGFIIGLLVSAIGWDNIRDGVLQVVELVRDAGILNG